MGKVNWLWWGCRFDFFFSSIRCSMCSWETLYFYRMICKNSISFFGKNSLNVPNVKLFSKTNHRFGFFMPFWWYLTPCTLHIKGIKNLNGLNDLNSLNNLIGLNDLSRFLKLKILRIIILYSESRKKSGQTFVYILLDFALHWHFMFIW